MDAYWRLMIALMAVIFLMAIVMSFWFRKRAGDEQKRELGMLSTETRIDPIISTASEDEEKAAPEKSAEPTLNKQHEDLLILSVIAKPNDHFASYDLLQAISAVGMQFGEMNIFHYYQQMPNGKQTLFSLASASAPGDFDLDRIGDFTCSGLILFLRLPSVSDPQYAFELMLTAAEQLVDDLDGVLRADPRTPWSDEMLNRYQEKIARVQLTETI